MDTAVAIIVLLWILLPYMDASAALCETSEPDYLTDKDVCLIGHTKEYMECKWRERIVVSKVLFRVCKREPDKCCNRKRSDVYFDTNACLTASLTGAEQVKYSSVINEVLEQCSQKRYCLIENTDGSAMTHLKTIDVGAGRRPAGMTVVYTCEKADDTLHMSVCEDRTETGKYVYLNGNFLSQNDGNLSCTCDIESSTKTPVDIHLHDVRLHPNNHLRLENILGERREYDSRSVVFGTVFKSNHYQLKLQYQALNTDEVDNIWINVTARISSVTVICKGPKTIQHATDLWSASTESEGTNEWYEDTSLIFLIIGFLTACALTGVLAIFIMLYKRWHKRGPFEGRTSLRKGDCYHLDKACGDPVYSEVKQTVSSNSSDYTVPYELKPVPKPRCASYQESGHCSRHLTSCPDAADIETLELRAGMLTVCLDDKL